MGHRPSKNTITGNFTSSHRGHDFSGKGDDGVFAYDSGEIIVSKNKYATHWIQGDSNDPTPWGLTTEDYGNFIKLKHEDGTFSLYAHLKQNSGLPIETKVVKGQRIATIGNTGNSTGAHLHFEVRNTADKTVEPVYDETPSMPENTDLNRLLTYYNVKTADELILMVDKELAFLSDARKRNTELESINKDHTSHLEELANKLGTTVDYPAILAEVTHLLAVEETKRQLERKLDQEEKKHVVEVGELKDQIGLLRVDVEKQQKENETLLQRLETLETTATQQQEVKEKLDLFRSFIEQLTKLFERKR